MAILVPRPLFVLVVLVSRNVLVGHAIVGRFAESACIAKMASTLPWRPLSALPLHHQAYAWNDAWCLQYTVCKIMNYKHR